MSNDQILSIDDQSLSQIMNKRHKSVAKSFKSPPQPKFCIKTLETGDGREVFINVLSYSRIANQLSEFDPVPLYGGMQIRSYNSIKNSLHHVQQQASSPPQLIFAVMASPEVLKKTGRNCPETPEQMNLVELMCEFVEAMNPGVRFAKKPEILKDRDLTGELKDIWSAVQNFRDKEKAGVSDIVVYTEFGPDTAIRTSNNNSSISEGKNFKSEFTNSSDEQQQQQPQPIEQQTSQDKSVVNAYEEDMPTNALENTSSDNIEIEKLSISDKKLKNNSNLNENESSEKNVKVQNQKNKESQHHFLPKFLTSSKEKDKEKQPEEQETKVKTKKSLNFFRRNKTTTTTSTTGSPTHNNNNANSNVSQKTDAE